MPICKLRNGGGMVEKDVICTRVGDRWFWSLRGLRKTSAVKCLIDANVVYCSSAIS